MKYFFFQEELVRWFAEEMSDQGLDVDQVDIAANSPLHLAAKHGCTTSAAALLHHGAQIALKVRKVIFSCRKFSGNGILFILNAVGKSEKSFPNEKEK